MAVKKKEIKESKVSQNQEVKTEGQTSQKEIKKGRNPRNILLKTIESKIKVLNYWRGKYLTALDEVKQARNRLSKLIEDNEVPQNEPIFQNQTGVQQSNNQTEVAAESQAEQQKQALEKLVSCVHCKIQKKVKEMHYYPGSMTHRCGNCKQIYETQLLESQKEQPEKEVEKPSLFRNKK